MKTAVKKLLKLDNKAIIALTKKNLLEEPVNIKKLWTLPHVIKLLNKQESNGSWLYPNKKAIL